MFPEIDNPWYLANLGPEKEPGTLSGPGQASSQGAHPKQVLLPPQIMLRPCKGARGLKSQAWDPPRPHPALAPLPILWAKEVNVVQVISLRTQDGSLK